jgi:hypothetical protein
MESVMGVYGASRWSAINSICDVGKKGKKDVDRSGPIMEAATKGSGWAFKSHSVQRRSA